MRHILPGLRPFTPSITSSHGGVMVADVTMTHSELPSNLVLKKVSPRIWLPAITIVWGIITMCLGFVHNYSDFVAVRALLGAAEGGLLPGMVSKTC